jgi:hypothetical protein
MKTDTLENVQRADRTLVSIYKDSPAWAGGKRPFEVSHADERALYLDAFWVLDERFDAGMKEIEAMYPDAVYFYVPL